MGQSSPVSPENRSEKFSKLFNWASEQGLVLHPHLERRCKEGIWGFYATDQIGQGEILASYPSDRLQQPEASRYPENASISARFIHDAAKAYEQDDDTFSPYLNFIDSLDEMREYATYFADEAELNALNDVSPILHREVLQHIQQTNTLVNALHYFDKSISKDSYLMMALNYDSRAIGSAGFVPIIDCFNHSDRKGLPISHTQNKVCLSAKNDYDRDAQVYVSYGKLDIYSHAINYNYFDAQDEHYILLGKRFNFPVRNASEQQFMHFLSKHYPVKVSQANGFVSYCIQDPEAYFSASGPSDKLLEIAKHLTTKKPGASQDVTSEDLKLTLQVMLDQLDQRNLVDRHAAKHIPKRIRRFYNVLKREKELIALNKNWLNSDFTSDARPNPTVQNKTRSIA